MDGSLRQLQKADTRRKIIRAAYLVFSEEGFHAPTSLIAKRAGVAHGTVFVHFPTLNDLLRCLISDFGDDLSLRLHTLSRHSATLQALLEEHLNVLQAYEGFYARLLSESDRLPPEARETFVCIQSTVAFHFSRVIERETDRGTVKRVPLHMLFNTWLALIHYYLLNRDLFASPGESVLKRYQETLVTTYLNLIGMPKEGTP